MKIKRLIPVLLVKNGLLVRSELFKYHQAVGDPIPTIKRLSDWNADEIVLINIGNNKEMDSRRDDKYHNLGSSQFSDLVRETTKFCHCPITIGGGLRTLEDIDELFNAGADKVVVNTLLFEDPALVKKAVKIYGGQAITASLDIFTTDGQTTVWTNNGEVNTHLSLSNSIKTAREIGAGEILINSINHDGSGKGYDKKILQLLNREVNFPIIINGGATKTEHFLEGLENPYIAAVAASNIFYFTELSYINIKKKIIEKGVDTIRDSQIDTEFTRREPIVDAKKRANLLYKGYTKERFSRIKYDGSRIKEIKYCRRCLYSSEVRLLCNSMIRGYAWAAKPMK